MAELHPQPGSATFWTVFCGGTCSEARRGAAAGRDDEEARHKKIRKMKALVIGATGAVGKDLVEQLLKVAQAMIRLAKADLNGTRTYDLKSKL